MKATKNAVLKYSNYTTSLTRSLKATERLHCRVNEEENAVYVCNGYFLVKLDRAEYDALVRPVTQRKAGNFVVENGQTNTAMQPLDMEKLLADAAHDLTPAPFLVDPGSKSTKAKIVPYYSKDGDFVAAFNSDYAAIISAGLPRRSKNPTSPMVVYSGNEPQAMILPVRLDDTKSRVSAAVRAYFTDKPQESAGEKAIRAREATADERVDMANQERDALRLQVEELQKALAEKTAEAAALTERLSAQTEPRPQEEATEPQQEQTPADKAAALVEKLAAPEGVAATIKGAQTAAPVTWLEGETDAHKQKIEAMGGKWSGKRSAWYFKIA